MTTSVEIEAIVRSVLQRMLSSEAAPSVNVPPMPLSVASHVTTLSHSLITLASLPANLNGISELKVSKQAVVTPAVRDFLNSRRIKIVRAATVQQPSLVTSTAGAKLDTSGLEEKPKQPQTLLIAGQATWYGSLSKPLCPKQTKLTDPSHDDAAALRTISAGIREGHQAGLLIASSAHAACWQAARDDKLRPVVVGVWSECKQILSEVPANLLIIANGRWNGPSTTNLIRMFLKHLKGN